MGNILGIQKKREESPEERKERLQRLHGVLIPPSFVVGSVGTKNMPLSTQAKIVSQPNNVLEYLWNTNSGNRILLEYMSPGFHFSVPITSSSSTLSGPSQDGGGEGGNLLISLDTTTTNSTISTISSQQQQQPLQQIWAGHGYGPIYVEGLMMNEQQPSLRIKYRHRPNSKFNIAARLSPGGTSSLSSSSSSFNNNDGNNNWIDASYRTRTSTGMEWMFGGWMTAPKDSLSRLLFRKNNGRRQASSSSTTTPLGIINVQTAVEYQESLICMAAAMPVNVTTSNNNISVGTPEIVSTLLSLNLNNTNTTSDGTTDEKHQPPPPPPPLWLTLRNDQHSSSSNFRDTSSSSGWKLNLSQSFTFDRPTWNILEDRAPNVRQTVAWAVQVEQQQQTDNNSIVGENDNYNNQYYNPWSMGVTWQLNRGFAIKGVFVGGGGGNSSSVGNGTGGVGGRLTYGVILKRWEQPRVTLSLLNQLDIQSRKHCFLGFGLELETTPLSFSSGSASSGGMDDSEYYNQSQQDGSASFSSVSTSAPPTKITIPKQQQNKNS